MAAVRKGIVPVLRGSGHAVKEIGLVPMENVLGVKATVLVRKGSAARKQIARVAKGIGLVRRETGLVPMEIAHGAKAIGHVRRAIVLGVKETVLVPMGSVARKGIARVARGIAPVLKGNGPHAASEPGPD